MKVLRFTGHLTRDGVAQVEQSFSAAIDGGDAVVVDLQDVELLATPGITMLLAAHRKLKQAGGRLVLSGVRGITEEALRRCRLHTILPVAQTLNEAVEQVRVV